MTPLGLVFAFVFGVSLFWGRRGLIVALACAAPFNDSIMAKAGSATLTPYYFGLMLLLGITFLLPVGRAGGVHDPGLARFLYIGAFVAYAVAVTAVMPHVFAGLPVFSSTLGLDEQYNNLQPLRFSSSNVAQTAYVTLNAAFLLVNYRDRLVRWTHLLTAFAVGSVVALVVAVIAPAPDDALRRFFDNAPRGFYGLTNLLPRGHFAEPSHLGAFALASAFFVVALLVTRSVTNGAARWALTALVLLDITLVAITASGTAVVGLGLALVLLLLAVVNRLVKGGSIPTPAAMLLMISSIVLVWLAPAIYHGVTTFVNHKQSQFSYVHRTFADRTALDVFRATDYFGAGLGSNRASSLLIMLLSTVGLLGTGLFVMLVVRAVRLGSVQRQIPAVIGLTAFLSAAAISLADLASPILWLLLTVCYGAGAGAEAESEPVQEQVLVYA